MQRTVRLMHDDYHNSQKISLQERQERQDGDRKLKAQASSNEITEQRPSRLEYWRIYVSQGPCDETLEIHQSRLEYLRKYSSQIRRCKTQGEFNDCIENTRILIFWYVANNLCIRMSSSTMLLANYALKGLSDHLVSSFIICLHLFI